MATAKIRVAFETITYESAENGEAEEQGWIDELGEDYTFREAFKLLQHTEPSSSHFHEGVWYTAYDYGEDYRTGERENRSYHLTASVAFQRRLFAALTSSRR